jgi:16S rRNA (uracil1498-N3)-methyltransferase
VLRVPVSKLAPGEITLDAQASRYVARVHRLGEGQALVLFDAERAVEAEATVIASTQEGVRCRVDEVREARVRARRATTLIQGIGKGDKLDAIVRDATELGATRIIAAETARSVVKLGDRAEARAKRWRRIAVEAARQCGRGDVPEVAGPASWEDALRLAVSDPARRDAETPANAVTSPMLFCLWERATDPIGPRLSAASSRQPLVFAVGPEGGLDEDEIEIARSLGFVPVSLGPFILRTETVAAAVLGAALVASA